MYLDKQGQGNHKTQGEQLCTLLVLYPSFNFKRCDTVSMLVWATGHIFKSKILKPHTSINCFRRF